ncbi:Bug family tripartite tricarboxylate transporter substrate binding protein [Desulforhopalus singaporensis]|uniref:Tripartite-type tricarboxylate transporter, receptor component TctC n=1 Tax=Desulforhopalus singaporensis TaxID=91360 RepID=A0A1H0PJ95_9BACT|nr:tripartite tricarboxylate transporter substrate binding protein [Desulforhopalus singaporensis]SDP05182.1 Tripartite-type tricarboxylate transporter, receptor component TctC [Desulforhopalus singaporensis]
MIKWSKKLVKVAAVMAVTLIAASVHAEYPKKPINVIVPWGAGGDSDLTTRVWADAVEKELGNPVVVINKAGGGGVVGTTFVANAKKDGYTLINAGLSNVLVTPNFSKTPYDFDSFVPVVKMTAVPLGIIVKNDSPFQTFDDFIKAAKEKTVTQGSWGAASSGTILASIIADQAGYTPKYVHANTTAESMVSVVGGHIDSAVSFPPAFGPHIKAGRARALVMNQKMDAYPGVPTFGDYGIKGSFEGWSGIFAPKGVPEEVVNKLVEVTKKVMKDPKVLKAYENMGAVVDFRYGEEWVKDLKVTYDIMNEAAQKMKE